MKQIISLAVCMAMVTSTISLSAAAESEMMQYEAESASITGELSVMENSNASGGKVVGNFSGSTDALTFQIDVPSDGFYDIGIVSQGLGGEKSNSVLLDDVGIGTLVSTGDTFEESILQGIMLDSGSHTVSITPQWGWIQVDSLTLYASEPISDSVYQVEDKLINDNASLEAKALFSYLCSTYGKQTLSGQFTDNGLNSDEFAYIYQHTGEYPAVLGLDLMNYCPSRVEKGADCEAVERAMEFYEKGGIITMSWHWNSPDKYLKEGTEENGSPRWWGGFYTSNTDIDITAIMNGEDPEGKALLDADIEAIAKELGKLRDAGIPVLWRPLHEASGGWFWWGAAGSKPYKAFWKYLYHEMTETYGLNNLIWVWNAGAADWYPGDEYVDIIGDDIYADSYAPSTSRFREILDFTDTNKMIALTENGNYVDMEQAAATNTMWAWFNTWGNGFTEADNAADESARIAIVKNAYKSDHVITLDELPDDLYHTSISIKGDVNADGEFTVADVVALQKWLLAVPDVHLADWKAGDLCADNKLDVFDLCMMKRELVTRN